MRWQTIDRRTGKTGFEFGGQADSQDNVMGNPFQGYQRPRCYELGWVQLHKLKREPSCEEFLFSNKRRVIDLSRGLAPLR
jgi:hypothetical protein